MFTTLQTARQLNAGLGCPFVGLGQETGAVGRVRKLPAKKKPAKKQAKKPGVRTSAPAPQSGGGNDELIAGARLQWSASFNVPQQQQSLLESLGTTFQRLVGVLQGKMSEAGLQSITVTRADWTSWSGLDSYAGKLVVQMTTPMNRERKAHLQWDLDQMAQQAGLVVDPNPVNNKLLIVRQGGSRSTNNAGAPPDSIPSGNPNDGGNPKGEKSLLEELLQSLGTSSALVLAGGLGMVIFLTRR